MLYIAVFFIILLYIFLFIVRIRAAVRYTRNKKEEWVRISFYTGKGLIRYENKIPLVKKENGKEKFKLVKGQDKEMEEGAKEDEKLGPFDFIKKYNSVRMFLKDHRSLFIDIRDYLNRHNVRVELAIKLKQGTGDAAQTGIVCGLLWSGAGILNSFIAKHLKVKCVKISITPCFNKRIFEVEAGCIFHVRLVHIIVVLIKIYYMKSKIRIRAKKSIGGEVSG
jgi:hypothetical protein